MYKNIIETANALKMSRQAVYALIRRSAVNTKVVAGRRLIVVDKKFSAIERDRSAVTRDPYPEATGSYYYAMRVCPCCGIEREISKAAVVCHRCAADIHAIRQEVNVIMQRAQRDGQIGWVRGLVCADCSAPATEWDHRYYAQPLLVESVCRRCNKLRGNALDAWDMVRAKIRSSK